MFTRTCFQGPFGLSCFQQSKKYNIGLIIEIMKLETKFHTVTLKTMLTNLVYFKKNYKGDLWLSLEISLAWHKEHLITLKLYFVLR